MTTILIVKRIAFLITIVLFVSCSGYTKKDGKVYLRRSSEARLGVFYDQVIDADYESFEEIKHNINSELGKDKNHVYYETTIIKDADPMTFKQIKKYYWKDNKHVFLVGYGNCKCLLDEADPNTFKVLGEDQWASDKKNIYYDFDKFELTNTDLFRPIDADWGKDNNYFYWHTLRIDSVDYSSIKILSPDYIIDKHHVFFHNKIVKDGNPKSFVANGAGFFGHDDKFMFEEEKNVGAITQEYRNTYIK